MTLLLVMHAMPYLIDLSSFFEPLVLDGGFLYYNELDFFYLYVNCMEDVSHFPGFLPAPLLFYDLDVNLVLILSPPKQLHNAQLFRAKTITLV